MTERKPRRKPASKTPPAADPTEIPESSPAAAVRFPIVGIGASAGGLGAFEAFFSGMPANQDPGMAFILVQHLAPDHKSILTELVRRYTRMQVFEVEDGMEVRPNCTYIIPPNRDMAFLGGKLQLLEQSVLRGQRLPIDFLFRSLAQDQRERAIGIVLSGTGSDGTMGVRAIKAEGGMVMVQSPESTEYDGMPRSALATGLVDYELLPARMPSQLMAFVKHAFGKPPRAIFPPTPIVENAIKKVFILLRSQTGHDFSLYKASTIHRRIDRRMAVHQIGAMDEYLRFLRESPDEVEALFRDLLINVTSFFRDPQAFKALEELVVPGLFADKAAGSVIRVWVPGCSTGEEAYSIAILLQEHADTLKSGFKVQIFATDIDSEAIATARTGLYPASIATDIAPERLSHFFTAEHDGAAYRVHKGIRDLLVFSEQDLIKDPPFSRLDMISCRNLLIYMGAELQRKVIPLFHYALKPGGRLFLGTAETVGEFSDIFPAVERKQKIYQRKGELPGVRHGSVGRFLPPMTPHDEAIPSPIGRTAVRERQTLRELTEQALLQQVVAAAALVNSRGDILYLHGRTGMYLEPAPGDAGVNNILKMAREGLRRDLTTALHKAAVTKEVARQSGLRVRTNGDFTTVDLTVCCVDPGSAATSEATLYLVILEEVSKADRHSAERMGGHHDTGDDPRITMLLNELRAKDEYIHSTREEMATSTEELKSSNEEMQSVNEELQAANEELETSKEELQSVNEELATVNSELQTKVTDLSRVNNDMSNLLAGTGIATVFVDHQLRLLRFTPTATGILNLIPGDVGRPVNHIVSNLVDYDGLARDTKAVLDTLIPREMEVQTRAGAWYTIRILPYRTLDNVIEGAVITFFDITPQKKAQNALLESATLRRLAVVVQDASDAIILQDLAGGILAWNSEAERMYGWSQAEALALSIRELIPVALRDKELAVAQSLGRAEVHKPYRTRRVAKDGRIVQVWLTATALVDDAGKVYAIATTEKRREPKGSHAKTP
jgi:two-component system CheB/CheR fusion protein